MAEIPEDLREKYAYIQHKMLGSPAQERQARPTAILIERIATLTAERDALDRDARDLRTLRDLQAAEIERLKDALRNIAENRGRCIYSLGEDYRAGSNAAFEQTAQIAEDALDSVKP